MAVVQHLSALALRQLLEGACKAAGFEAGAAAVEVVVGALARRFTDHSQKLTRALLRANERAWRALELALAGDSWWGRVKVALARREGQGFREGGTAGLSAAPLA